MVQLIKNEILSEIDHVRKGLKKILGKEHLKSNHVLKLNVLFDISKCKCFQKKSEKECIYSTCTCPNEDKIINLNTYLGQKFDSCEIVLSEAEKSKFEEILSGK